MIKLISALCITYGRHHLLEESVESFLRQDYPHKELIIVNDLSEQTLIFNHPQVKIFNFKERFPTIGDKRNKSVELSKGDILIGWDDDDIYLPWCFSQTIKEFEFNSLLEAIKPDRAWCRNGTTFKRPYSNCYANIASYTRGAFHAINGYISMNSGQDVNFYERLKKHLLPEKKFKLISYPEEEYAFIYGWGTGFYHLSGYGSDKNNNISGFTKIEQSIKSKPIEPVVELKPHWKQDYVKITRDILKEAKNNELERRL
jgi:glycosyltransferase involved in cell wall biosynthesis